MKYFSLLFLVVNLSLYSQNIDSLLTSIPFNNNLVLDNNEINFTENYYPSGSAWAIDSFSENTVFQSELEYINELDSTKSFQIRFGKGGQLYSLRSSFGESVPPQWRHSNWVEEDFGGGTSYAPWVDEVWQMVCVDGNLHSSPDSNYFIHQAGVYLKTETQNEPFFSPLIASYYNEVEKSYTSVNWGQQAHTNSLEYTGFTSSILYYTKYRSVGDGILQVDNMIYNFGNDNISFLNMPWGGVRNSTLDHFFISNSDNTFTNSHAIYGQGPIVQTSSTGGWVAWSNDSTGNSATLAMAHPLTTNTNNSVFRYGEAGNLSANWNNRDYNVFEMIRFPSSDQLSFGKSMSFRYFYVLGASVDSVKNSIITNNLISNAFDTAYTPSFFEVNNVEYIFEKNGSNIEATISNTPLGGLLMAVSPFENSFPLFKITSQNLTQHITSNPYFLSNKPWDGVTKSIELLGFVANETYVNVINDTICYNSDYTFADGSSLNNITSDTSLIIQLQSTHIEADSLIVTNIFVNNNNSLCDNSCDIIPTGLFVDNIIHSRVNFNWSQADVSPSHYMIRYRPVGTSSWSVMTAGPVNDNPFNGTSRTRYFMEPGTTYEWNIRARVLNDDGSSDCQSPWSTSSQFTTLPACPNLENLSVSTEANWVILNANAPSEEWGVWQSKAKMKELGTNSFRYANGDSDGNINVLKGNFNPNTEYQWHTKAWCTGNVDELGNSDPQYHSGWGEFSFFTTEEICDKMPINLSTSSNGTNTAITMSWDLPLSGVPNHYFLELNNDNTGQQWQWNNIAGNQISKSKFGLNQGDYSWRIRGACGTNGTSWATIFSELVYYTLGGARLDNEIVSNLNVYPNPSRDAFNISFSSDELQFISIRVVNVIGKEIFKEELSDFDGIYTHELDMSKNSKGVYFLEINSEKGTLNSKMVLQ